MPTYPQTFRASSYGKFVVKKYLEYSSGNKRGVEFLLEFTPSALSGGAPIGLIQIARAERRAHGVWQRYYTGADALIRDDFYGNWFVDNGNEETPVFKMAQSLTTNFLHDIRPINATNDVGRYQSRGPALSAKLSDEPKRNWTAGEEILHSFETVAMALTPGVHGIPGKGKVLGALTWGYTVNVNGDVALNTIRVQDTASLNFKRTRETWNGAHGVKIPTPV